MSWNESLFRTINRWPDDWSVIFEVLSEGNKWTIVRIGLAVVLLAIAIKNGRRGWLAVAMAGIGVGISNEACDFLKATLQELRPNVDLADTILRVPRLTSFGTASSHAANTAVVGTVLYGILGGRHWIWLVVSGLVGISRVYVGVHYPSQVGLGWTVGILIGLCFVMLHARFERRTQPGNEHKRLPSDDET